MIKVAILGRPNVGKSTIFNMLSRSHKAIVYDFPGVTRDRLYAVANVGSFQYSIIDTPGLDSIIQKNFHNQIEYQAILACTEADIVIFIVEEGVLTSMDLEIANHIRKNCKKIILVKNKADRNVLAENYYKLGFGEGLKLSAIHRIGFKELKLLLSVEMLKCLWEKFVLDSISIDSEIDLSTNELEILNNLDNLGNASEINSKQGKLIFNLVEKLGCLPKSSSASSVPKICIVGRPNSGKSTYINTILKDPRLLTDDQAGTTRDSIEIKLQFNEREIVLVDTAGMRKKNKVYDDIEVLSVRSSIEAIKVTDVAILMIEAENLIQHQDLEIMDVISKSGKGLVIAINKCDLINAKQQKHVNSIVDTNIFQMTRVPVIYCSNFRKINLEEVLDRSLKVFDSMSSKITTSKLNVWLKKTLEEHSPPVIFKTPIRIKMKYITQVSSNPLIFKIFGNADIADIPNDYVKYLINSLGQKFELFGVAIRLKFVKNNNPYKP